MRQAAVARAAGRAQLAENLERAAELASLPDDEVLAVYTALRPRRATADELETIARHLAEGGAPLLRGLRARGRRRARRARACCGARR